MDPWQLQPGSLVFSNPLEKEWAASYQVRGKGLISASMSSWKLNFCGTFQAGRAGEMKAREDYSPTPEPSLPGLPLTEGNPPFPGPSQVGA